MRSAPKWDEIGQLDRLAFVTITPVSDPAKRRQTCDEGRGSGTRISPAFSYLVDKAASKIPVQSTVAVK